MSPPGACVVQPGLCTDRALHPQTGHLARDLGYSHLHPPGSGLTAAESEASTPSLLFPLNCFFFFLVCFVSFSLRHSTLATFLSVCISGGLDPERTRQDALIVLSSCSGGSVCRGGEASPSPSEISAA